MRELATGTSRRTATAAVGAAAVRYLVTAPTAFVVLPVALHRLPTGEYGLWAVLSVILAIGFFAEAGIRVETVRRVADANGRGDSDGILKAAREGAVALSLIAVLVVALGVPLSPVVVRFFFHGHSAVTHQVDAVLLCRFVVGLLGLSLLSTGMFAVLEGLQRTDWASYADAAGNVVAAGLVVAGLLLGWGLWAFPAGGLCQLAISSSIRLIGLRAVLGGIRPLIARVPVSELAGYLGVSTFVVLAQISNVFDYEFDKVLLARYVGAPTAGLYDAGSSLALGARAAVVIPLVVLLPGVAEFSARAGDRARSLFIAAERLTGLCVLVLLGGVLVLGHATVRVWLGPSRDAAGTTAEWLAVALALNCVAAPAASYVMARRWTGLIAVGSTVNIVVNSVASCILTQHYGLRGALVGSVIANAAATGVFLLLAAKREGVLSPGLWLRPAAAAALAVVAARWMGIGTGVHTWPQLLAHAAFWTVLSAAAAALGGVLGRPRSYTDGWRRPDRADLV